MSSKLKLNRKQRRQAARANNGETVIQMMEDATRVAIDTAVEYYSTVTAYVLLERLKFGKKKIELTLAQIQEVIVAIENDEITLDQLKEHLKENDIELK